jgi:hypothetical protein
MGEMGKKLGEMGEMALGEMGIHRVNITNFPRKKNIINYPI